MLPIGSMQALYEVFGLPSHCLLGIKEVKSELAGTPRPVLVTARKCRLSINRFVSAATIRTLQQFFAMPRAESLKGQAAATVFGR